MGTGHSIADTHATTARFVRVMGSFLMLSRYRLHAIPGEERSVPYSFCAGTLLSSTAAPTLRVRACLCAGVSFQTFLVVRFACKYGDSFFVYPLHFRFL